MACAREGDALGEVEGPDQLEQGEAFGPVADEHQAVGAAVVCGESCIGVEQVREAFAWFEAPDEQQGVFGVGAGIGRKLDVLGVEVGDDPFGGEGGRAEGEGAGGVVDEERARASGEVAAQGVGPAVLSHAVPPEHDVGALVEDPEEPAGPLEVEGLNEPQVGVAVEFTGERTTEGVVEVAWFEDGLAPGVGTHGGTSVDHGEGGDLGGGGEEVVEGTAVRGDVPSDDCER